MDFSNSSQIFSLFNNSNDRLACVSPNSVNTLSSDDPWIIPPFVPRGLAVPNENNRFFLVVLLRGRRTFAKKVMAFSLLLLSSSLENLPRRRQRGTRRRRRRRRRDRHRHPPRQRVFYFSLPVPIKICSSISSSQN